MNRSEVLTEYLEGHGWSDLVVPHDPNSYGVLSQHYLKELEAEWETENQPFTIMEFLLKIDPQLVIPVHYSGAEDSRYNNNSILSRGELLTWITETSQLAGINSRFLIPEAGQVIPLQN